MILKHSLLSACVFVGMTLNAYAQDQGVPDASQSSATLISDEAEARIAALHARPEIQAAFATIESMRARNNERLVELTEIAAPPFEEQERAAELAERVRALGLSDVSIDESGNVIARRPGADGSRTVAIAAHIDTVFPAETDVTVRREGDVFFAPGIGDNTRGVVALLALVEAMQTHEIETQADVLFIGDVGEEGLGDLRGVRHLFRDGAPKIDSFIAIDGGDTARLITTAVGSNRYRVTFSGPGGHSYGAFGRAHPHQALAEAITLFTQSATPITQDGTKATFSVGRIGGGTSINSIPFTSWMEVDMRSSDPTKLAELDAAFQSAMQKALEVENERRRRDDALTVEVKPVGKRPAGSTDLNSSLVQNAGAAVALMGVEPQFAESSTDSNIPMSLGIPAITISRGGLSKNAHAPNESWEDKDSHLAIQAALLLLVAEAGPGGAVAP